MIEFIQKWKNGKSEFLVLPSDEYTALQELDSNKNEFRRNA
jgi:hypothetical protein